MCGVIGYIGPRNSVDVVIQGLCDLAERGVDSAGFGVLTPDGYVLEKRAKEYGEHAVLPAEVLRQWQAEHRVQGSGICIGHGRWATHGNATVNNAHPHLGACSRVALVHNGSIYNYDDLKGELERAGVAFYSDTDTEVIANLIERELDSCEMEEAMRRVLPRLDGSYVLVVCDRTRPDEMFVVRRGGPLYVGLGDGEAMVASNQKAIARIASHFVKPKQREVLVIRRSGIQNSSYVPRPVDVDPLELAPHGYAHHMLKEMLEQPKAVRNAMGFGARLDLERGIPRFGGFRDVEHALSRIEHVVFVACGTAYHAALLGARYMRDIAGISHVEVLVASEADIGHMRPHTSMLIAVSQSGETFDTMRAVDEANVKGILTCGVVNDPGSWISEETTFGVHTQAGHETAVPSTKAFLSQVATLYMIAVYLGRQRRLSAADGIQLLSDLVALPDVLETMYADSFMRRLQAIARERLAHRAFVGFIGKRLMYPIALESALKFKEITYIPSEAYPSGELKHGPLALLCAERPTIALVHNGPEVGVVISNMKVVQRTYSPLVIVADESLVDRLISIFVESEGHLVISVPRVASHVQPIVHMVVGQMLAYFTALEMDRAIDNPRHLAKTVTTA